MTSWERSPCNSIRPTMARSREVRKRDQKRATSSTDRGHEDAFGFLHAQAAQRRTRPAVAQWRTPPIEMVKPGSKGAGRIRKLVAQRALYDAHASVDGGGRGLGMMAGLESEVVQQNRCAERTLADGIGMVHAGPPAQEVQQIHGIAAQGILRQAAHTFAIQETIDPFHFAACWLLDDAKSTSCVAAVVRMDHLEGHARAFSNRHMNCWASPPWTKKLLGSCPSGKQTRRAIKPCSLSRHASPCAACWPLPLLSVSKAR